MDVKNSLDRQSLAASALGAAAGIAVGDAHASGRIVLDDAGTGNVPDIATYVRLATAFPAWGKAPITYCVLVHSRVPGVFSQGYGKILESDADTACTWLRDAYTLTWILDCFTKPTISLIDGSVDGAGVGLSLYGTHRVGGEGYRLSMPGPGIGWFPDHGMAHVFARLPAKVGVYLALTGHAIGRNDAHRLGLLTQCIGRERFEYIAASLADADPVDPLLDDMHEIVGGYDLDQRLEAIVRCFSGDSVEDILERLKSEKGDGSAWARTVAADIEKAHPLALKITMRLVREAGAMDLRETLMFDYRIAARLVRERAAGSVPRPTLADVDDAWVAQYFEPLPHAELGLRTRAEMQAMG